MSETGGRTRPSEIYEDVKMNAEKILGLGVAGLLVGVDVPDHVVG